MRVAPATPMTNLMNFNQASMKAYLISLGETAYRGTQIFQWIHQQGLADIHSMSNLKKSLREQLTQCAQIKLPELIASHQSEDGTRKWLLKMDCGNCVETVYIPERDRGTLCVSSQIGCSLTCTFCATGAQGFNRNLSVAEIIGQVWIARQALQQTGKITNVVMMGMGEPLLNFENVVSAMDMMLDDHGYGLSKYRVTLSTSGIVPRIYDLAHISKVALAISLHAPNDELRDELVPINKKYPLRDLLEACRAYFDIQREPKRYVTMEYVMLDGINDTLHHAKQLIKLLRNIRCKVNLIPFNPFPHTLYRRSPETTIHLFQHAVQQAGILTTIRKTRGNDIDGACGQLAGEFNDRTTRRERFIRKTHDNYATSRTRNE